MGSLRGLVPVVGPLGKSTRVTQKEGGEKVKEKEKGVEKQEKAQEMEEEVRREETAKLKAKIQVLQRMV